MNSQFLIGWPIFDFISILILKKTKHQVKVMSKEFNSDNKSINIKLLLGAKI